jgi:processing peptidase subunit alpha
LLPWEVKTAHGEVKKAQDTLRADPDAMVRQLLHSAAYCNNTLGLSRFASERSLASFTPETIRGFLLDHFAPERMALVGVNIGHEELGKWAMRAFADYNAVPFKERTEAKAAYTGGDARADGPTAFCHLAIGFESAGSRAGLQELATTAVLQPILGEGSAASTGVGHGATSRLAALVGQSPYVESCSAFNETHSDSGLFGVYSVVQPGHAGEVVAGICKALGGLAKTSSEELTRAKAVLKSSLHLQADDSSALLQDLGTQVVRSGSYVAAGDVARAVAGVSESAVAAAAKKILASKPTVAAFGDCHAVPHYSAIEAALKA